jgi:mRNA interferase MazF
MKTRRGDVVLVLFPNSDLRTAKRRPALVLQRDALGSGLEQTIVAMISSNLARRGHDSRVFVSKASPEGRAAGLRLDSVVMTDNLATVLDTEVDSLLGRLSKFRHCRQSAQAHAWLGINDELSAACYEQASLPTVCRSGESLIRLSTLVATSATRRSGVLSGVDPIPPLKSNGFVPSTPRNSSNSAWRFAAAGAFVLPTLLFLAGCANSNTETSSKSPSGDLVFYSVPFR